MTMKLMLPTTKDVDVLGLETFKNQANCFVNFCQALQVLGKNEEWFATLQLCSSRWKKLQKKGFSGDIFTLSESPEAPQVKVITFQDWFALASYLAGYANQSAIRVLQIYASCVFSQKN